VDLDWFNTDPDPAFCSIWIQAKTELTQTISFSNFFEIKTSKFESNQKKNNGVIPQNFFQKVDSAILYLFSGKSFLKNN
jgi:hypothetical protein